jgi:hypothetical protein
MEELKINIPEGYEIDKKNSTFECIKFKKLSPKYPTNIVQIEDRKWYIDANGDIESTSNSNDDLNNISTKERAEAFLALTQLVELRDAWNKIDGFVADWTNVHQYKYDLCIKNNEIQSTHKNTSQKHQLYFGSVGTRDLFFGTFKDLIETAKELL